MHYLALCDEAKNRPDELPCDRLDNLDEVVDILETGCRDCGWVELTEDTVAKLFEHLPSEALNKLLAALSLEELPAEAQEDLQELLYAEEETYQVQHSNGLGG